MHVSNIPTCFIVNSSAGRGIAGKWIQALAKKTESRFKLSKIIICRDGDDLSEIARESASTFETIVACGGDGTVSRVVNGIAGTEASLGILPVGSGNDFARTLRIPGNLEENLGNIAAGARQKTDLIKISGDVETWCCNTFGLGFDGLANYHARHIKMFSGSMAYVFGALKSAFQFYGTEMSIKTDGRKLQEKCLMATLCNGRDEGGIFRVAPGALTDDGLLDLLIVNEISLYRKCLLFKEFLSPSGKRMSGVQWEKSVTVKIESKEPVFAHCDGEHAGSDIKTIFAELKPGKIEVITGRRSE